MIADLTFKVKEEADEDIDNDGDDGEEEGGDDGDEEDADSIRSVLLL